MNALVSDGPHRASPDPVAGDAPAGALTARLGRFGADANAGQTVLRGPVRPGARGKGSRPTRHRDDSRGCPAKDLAEGQP